MFFFAERLFSSSPVARLTKSARVFWKYNSILYIYFLLLFSFDSGSRSLFLAEALFCVVFCSKTLKCFYAFEKSDTFHLDDSFVKSWLEHCQPRGFERLYVCVCVHCLWSFRDLTIQTEKDQESKHTHFQEALRTRQFQECSINQRNNNSHTLSLLYRLSVLNKYWCSHMLNLFLFV